MPYCQKDPPPCICGHSWEAHHHGVIMNAAYPSENHKIGHHRGVTGDECEAEQHEGAPLNGPASCFCGHYINSVTPYYICDCTAPNYERVKMLRKLGGLVCTRCRKIALYLHEYRNLS